jgi:hypothetical protein
MSIEPAPAWTTNIDGKTYTVKLLGGRVYEVCLAADRIGTFELLPDTAQGSEPFHASGLEARAVADAFVTAYRNGDAQIK